MHGLLELFLCISSALEFQLFCVRVMRSRLEYVPFSSKFLSYFDFGIRCDIIKNLKMSYVHNFEWIA